MSICKKSKIELFDDFYEWLKKDGLTPKKSERLHRKKIFSNFMSNEKMTMENFNDFLKENQKDKIKVLKGKTLLINNKPCFVKDIEFLNAQNDFKIISDSVILNCKSEHLEEIKNLEI